MSRFERACILCLVCSAYLITQSCQVHVSRFHGSCSGPMLSSRKDGESVMFMQRMLAAISAQQGGRVSRLLDAVFLFDLGSTLLPLLFGGLLIKAE